MGSPLSPVLADMFLEVFESTALNTADRCPSTWLRYVDDTLAPSTHRVFLDHLKNLHPNIKFTMDQEEGTSIPFLDVKVSRQPHGSLGHAVYRKPTHTDRYLHSASFHHPRI